MDLTCTDECIGGHAVCVLSGEIDLSTAGEFRRAAIDAMDRHGAALTLDLSQVTFMDCTGVGVLIFLRAEARARGGHITLPGTPLRVSQLLELTGLQSLFEPGSAPGTMAATPV